jgi:transcriptional regulator with XRE-family HTH domain
MAESLGDRIRKARECYGMSQVELARRVDVSKQTMWEIESNRTLDPGALKVKAIAKILRVSTDYLLGLTEDAVDRRTIATVDALDMHQGINRGLYP